MPQRKRKKKRVNRDTPGQRLVAKVFQYEYGFDGVPLFVRIRRPYRQRGVITKLIDDAIKYEVRKLSPRKPARKA